MKYAYQIASVALALGLLGSLAGCGAADTPAQSTASAAPSSAAASSAASGTAAGYSQNGKAVTIGEEVSVDLNGDGSDDTVHYDCDPNSEEHPVTTLSVNGTDYLDTINTEGSDVWIYFPSDTEYYITDLDTNDSYREIAIMDAGPSDDPTTYFFRYDGTDLKCIGVVPDFISSESFAVKGDGTLTASMRLNVLQTWCTTATYRVTGDTLALEPSALYTPRYYGDTEQTVTLAKPITVYAENDLSSASSVWDAGETPITFLATDNEHWVQMQRGGETGWLSLTDFCTMADGGDATQAFNGLFLAD